MVFVKNKIDTYLDSFLQSPFGPKASGTISQRRFLLNKNDTYLNFESVRRPFQ